MIGSEALDVEFFCADLDRDISIRDYLKELLCTLIKEDEGFSGKRPFGNSGWQYDLAKGLVKAGLVKGTYDEEDDYGEVDDWGEYETVLINLIVEHM